MRSVSSYVLFLWCLYVDLMVHIFSSIADLMVVVTPPLEISISSLTWNIYNFSKIATFNLPPIVPVTLGLICIS
jgi:hypothetical protein